MRPNVLFCKLFTTGTILLSSCDHTPTSKKAISKDSISAPAKQVELAKDTTTKYTTDIYQKYIGGEILTLQQKMLPEWSLPNPDEWENIWFDQYLKNGKGNLVNYLTADFNGDGKADYAFLLKNANKVAVWVLQSSGDNGDNYETIKLNEFGMPSGENKLEIGLELIPIGDLPYIDFDSDKEPEPIKLKNPAIQVVYFETAATTYYWDKTKYLDITTGD